jgi:hypothetical protein
MAKSNPRPKAATKSASPVVPNTVSKDDLEYHQKMLERIEWAQEAQKSIEGIQVAWQLWSSHLAEKYQLSPKDDINPTGAITRNS